MNHKESNQQISLVTLIQLLYAEGMEEKGTRLGGFWNAFSVGICQSDFLPILHVLILATK